MQSARGASYVAQEEAAVCATELSRARARSVVLCCAAALHCSGVGGGSGIISSATRAALLLFLARATPHSPYVCVAAYIRSLVVGCRAKSKVAVVVVVEEREGKSRRLA